MNIIVTDCENDKRAALNAVCREHFGLHNFNIHNVKQSLNGEDTLSLEALFSKTRKRIDSLRSQCSPALFNKEDVVYYATLQKGFVETPEEAWLFTAYVLFVKDENFFPGMPESVPLKKEVWPFMRLPKKVRYEQKEKFYPALKTTGLITCISGLPEIDWYKQAFRTALQLCIRS